MSKKSAKIGRPPLDKQEKLSVIYGVRFKPSEADEIKKATNFDDSLVARIRDAILREVRKKPPKKKPKPRRL